MKGGQLVCQLMNGGIEARKNSAMMNQRGFKSLRTKLQTFAALHADADVRSFRTRCHTKSTVMKMRLSIKVAVNTIGPAGVSIQHVISLDVRGDAKDLLRAGACTRGVPTLNQEYSCKWHSSTVRFS